MDESNIALVKNITDDLNTNEVQQCLSSELINGVLNVMQSQFNTGEEINNAEVQKEEQMLIENEESVSVTKTVKRKRKGTVKTVKKAVPSCSKDGVPLSSFKDDVPLSSFKDGGQLPSFKHGASTPSFKDGGESEETSPIIKKNIKESETGSLENIDELKKSKRRRSSREFSESVVQNAIARKEMSFTQNSADYLKRPSRPLKPTRKVLDNIAAASQKRVTAKSKDKPSDEAENDHKKVPKKSPKSPKNGKKLKLEESDHESVNSDESFNNLIKSVPEEITHTRRSQRISSAASKKDDESPINSPEKSNIVNLKLPTEHLTASEQLIESRICLCTTTTNIIIAKDKEIVFCEALDSIDGKIIGCSRTLNAKEVTAVRASLRIPYSLFCKMHTDRLKLHNCCPSCGMFCTQGTFSECAYKHQYHNHCHMLIGEKVCCPHCEMSTVSRNVKLTLECHQSVVSDDIFIPKQRVSISSDKRPVANQSSSNTSHVINTTDVTLTTTNQIASINKTVENESNLNDIPNKTNDIPSKFYQLLSKTSMETNSSSNDVNMTASANNQKKTMTARYKNPLEVSSVTNLISIQNLEQQNDDSEQGGSDFELPFDLNTIIDCIFNEKYEQLRCLLDAPIDFSLPFDYPIHFPPSTISNTPAAIRGTILHYACALGRTTAVRMLVRSLKPNTNDLRRLLLLMDSDQSTPLAVALANGHNECAKELLECGVCSITVKGADGMSPLHICARAGNLTGCDLLLTHTNPTTNTYINSADDGGWTALVWAAEHAHADVVALLLARGAERMRGDVERNVAAHWACYAGHVDVLNVLLDVGAGEERAWELDQMVNAVNIQGDTPLHLAAHQGHLACITQLLAHGAEPSLRNKMQETPLDLVTDPDSEAYRVISKYNVITNGNNISEGKTEFGDGGGSVLVNGGGLIRRPMKHMLLNNDISRGREINPIQLINTIDSTPEPLDYTYVTGCCLTTDNVRVDMRITALRHCDCSAMHIVSCLAQVEGTEGDDEDGRNVDTLARCNCLDEVRLWYDVDGKLVKGFNFQDPPTIFECNDLCACNTLTCANRVVQKNGSLMNSSIRTQVFRTKNRGWALRTLRNISQGSYVCEYVGEVLTDRDVNLRPDDSYVFDLDSTDSELYCIDAKLYGNMSRFINHSCQPNLVPVKVFTNHQDLRFPRIAFFANRNIHANDELSFDYGDKFWIIKYKTFTCECGMNECKYSKDKISATLATMVATSNGR